MKKTLYTAILLILSIMFSGNIYASDLGELISINDRVIPDGENAIITQTIKAVTGTDGSLAVPYYKNSEILSLEIKKGSSADSPQKAVVGDKTYRLLDFGRQNSEVEFTLTLRMEGAYELEEADLGDTFPSNAFEIQYKVINTSPLNIGKYSVEVAAPGNFELLNIENFSAKKPYSIFREGNYAFGAYNFKGIDAGEEIKFTMNVYRTSRLAVVLIWISGILLSAMFMFKNRELLAKAKALKSKSADAA